MMTMSSKYERESSKQNEKVGTKLKKSKKS